MLFEAVFAMGVGDAQYSVSSAIRRFEVQSCLLFVMELLNASVSLLGFLGDECITVVDEVVLEPK